jgi:rhodanese-related sulfurtransferase
MQDLITFLTAHLALTYTLAIVLVLLMIVEFLRLKRQNYNVNVPKAIQLINRENAIVIDIRPKDIFQKGHIIDSQSLTAKEIQENPKKIEKFRTKPIILVCHSGIESQKVAAFLLKQGYNVYSMAGGIRAWMAAELPLVKE